MERLIDADELLKAMDTWDKFGCDADTKLVSYQDHYIPYIHYDDMLKAVNGMSTVEAIPKADYENRLKADMVAMLTEIQLEIEELDVSDVVPEYQDGAEETKEYIANMIEEKINSLKEAKDG